MFSDDTGDRGGSITAKSTEGLQISLNPRPSAIIRTGNGKNNRSFHNKDRRGDRLTKKQYGLHHRGTETQSLIIVFIALAFVISVQSKIIISVIFKIVKENIPQLIRKTVSLRLCGENGFFILN